MRTAPDEGRRAVEKQGIQEHALSSTPRRVLQEAVFTSVPAGLF
jgi:hypothetical protein